MKRFKFTELEAAVIERNPLLADRLKPGLSENEILIKLKRAKVERALAQIIELYSWRNGTVLDRALMVSRMGFFPHETYQFIDLEKALMDMNAYKDCVCSCFKNLSNLKNQFLPIFWNGSTNWLALDLKSPDEGRVVLMRYFVREASLQDGHYIPEIHETEPPREAYRSFVEFVEDAIRANKNNSSLICFRPSQNLTSEPLSSQPEALHGANAPNTDADEKQIPATENTLALRTDYSDEAAWESLCAAIQDPDNDYEANLDFVSDPKYDGLPTDQLPALLPEEYSLTFAFIIDHITLSHLDRPILVIDLHDRPGRTFRVIPSEVGSVENNLSIANMGFDEFADAADKTGIFRGFREK